ncbi:hypothetical protein J5N97_005703 [Dioscorea zingiberensis]|uniref:Uncharacterized protein n=1 Tax=Dioscorea zingiberensis TaxID=325984 RepID=A0A9D5HTA4_9LILI|nr:hypothetical protein J5N97_005703 [Dioscorea zingiberensis]
MEELKKSSSAYLSELRLEDSWSAISFSDPCPCCGSKKRRSRQPLSGPRKKLLVFNAPSTPLSSPPAAAALPPPNSSPVIAVSPAPSQPLNPRSTSISSGRDFFQSPMRLSPPPGWRPIASLSPPELAMTGDRRLERSGSSAGEETRMEEKTVSCLAVERKEDGGKEREESVTQGHHCEEISVSVRCDCGTAREIILRSH